ncbi:FAD-dependent monooxygenase [Methylobacterium bullatum]|uniref:Pentachlorophenol 4-monooxygenase n=1 Tax=Methylobacterium bullatum TaxID=570505 RepID=A0A679K213_9HYPH|nr:Pentachlorophenol 4-monooxygenase [Methylobacterium bullatum]
MLHALIVGAGPVGLTLAAELARYGIGLRLIDKSPQPTQTSKALVVWARTLELMDRMGCRQAFLDAGLRAHGATLRSAGSILGHIRFDTVASAYNFALMIPQRETERLLIEHLATFGVAVEREVELVSFVTGDGHVEATLRHADGAEETMSTSWLIGCDGAHSKVRHGLDLAFAGEAQGDDWLLADIRLEGDGAPPGDEIATYLHRDGPLVVFPIPGGRTRVIAQVGKTDPAHPRPDPTLDAVQALADLRAGGFRVVDPVWLTHFRINERKVSQYAQGRAVLAGDAAHIHSPAGGQGMNTGMQDAINLAWKLAMVEREQAAPSLLDSYSPERNAVGDMVLRNAGRLTDMATLSNPVAQGFRNLALRFMLGFHAVQDKMATTMSEVGIAYADSPLSRGPQAGMRWAPAQDDGKPPGSGSVPLFVLYAADSERGAAFAARFPALVEPTPRRPPDGDRLILVRPDGYVGFSGTAESWEEAGGYLARLGPDRP